MSEPEKPPGQRLAAIGCVLLLCAGFILVLAARAAAERRVELESERRRRARIENELEELEHKRTVDVDRLLEKISRLTNGEPGPDTGAGG